MMRVLAEGASVPVACHVDHAYSLDECKAGLDEGFGSVMIDGSAKPLPENIELTLKVVELARRYGACVEGEIGIVGYVDGRPSQATSPQEARDFEQATRIDALAVSVGNVHLSTETAHPIDFAALAAIETLTRTPLVLHGGSGVSAQDRRRLAAQTRVRKLNIGTELRMAFGRGLRSALNDRPGAFDRIEILAAAMPEVRAEASRALRSLCAE
jgi:fructose-bisphosphate aldolase class II